VLLDLGFAPVFDPLTSRSEPSHPGAGFLDERSRSHDTHAEDRNVLRIGKLAPSFAVVRRRAMGLHRNGAEELLEERASLGELGGQIPSDLRHGGLGDHQTKEIKLAEALGVSFAEPILLPQRCRKRQGATPAAPSGPFRDS
jgi:hypothetical protein